MEPVGWQHPEGLRFCIRGYGLCSKSPKYILDTSHTARIHGGLIQGGLLGGAPLLLPGCQFFTSPALQLWAGSIWRSWFPMEECFYWKTWWWFYSVRNWGYTWPPWSSLAKDLADKGGGYSTGWSDYSGSPGKIVLLPHTGDREYRPFYVVIVLHVQW